MKSCTSSRFAACSRSAFSTSTGIITRSLMVNMMHYALLSAVLPVGQTSISGPLFFAFPTLWLQGLNCIVSES